MAESPLHASDALLEFWFSAEARPRWFLEDRWLDREVNRRFADLWEMAAEGHLDDWAGTPHGLLALVLLLDQVPRHMFRGTERAYSTDARALAWARIGVDRGDDALLDTTQRRFLFLPFEHSENLSDQKRAVALFRRWNDDPGGLDYALRHRSVIERFGRFPHRNAALGRATTPDEADFLAGRGAPY
ncbi:MAG: DUF924 domain-containing protein [Alphaproteobacteria bacterium]|nr:DUF924 domain-containing protein [Alphaproteobacteria bacterium]